MKTHLACLAILGALFSGCAAPNTNVTGYDMPKGFVYPATNDAFLNEAIAAHKAYAEKDATELFTAPAPKEVSTCGLAVEKIRSLFIYDKEAAKKLEEKTKKAAVRLTGMEASIHFMNEDPDFQILASTCSAPGIPGSVTVRFNLGLDGENAMGGTSKTRSKTVAFLALDEGGQPKTMTQLLKTEGTTTGASDMTVKLPIMLMYSPVDGSKTVTFSKIVDMDMVVVMEKLAEKRSKTTTWTGGVMSSVSHMKNGKMHGEMISFAQKTKIPGMGWIDVPESRFCYKDNMQVKTTGACLVD